MLAPQALGLNPTGRQETACALPCSTVGWISGTPIFGGDRIAGSIALVGSGTVQDGSADSHGTASAGIVAGPRRPFDGGCRYGVAADALADRQGREDSGRSDSFAVELACAWALARAPTSFP